MRALLLSLVLVATPALARAETSFAASPLGTCGELVLDGALGLAFDVVGAGVTPRIGSKAGGIALGTMAGSLVTPLATVPLLRLGSGVDGAAFWRSWGISAAVRVGILGLAYALDLGLSGRLDASVVIGLPLSLVVGALADVLLVNVVEGPLPARERGRSRFIAELGPTLSVADGISTIGGFADLGLGYPLSDSQMLSIQLGTRVLVTNGGRGFSSTGGAFELGAAWRYLSSPHSPATFRFAAHAGPALSFFCSGDVCGGFGLGLGVEAGVALPDDDSLWSISLRADAMTPLAFGVFAPPLVGMVATYEH